MRDQGAAPIADIRDEARRVVSAADAAGVRARVLGGVAVAMHDHVPLPASLTRSYADIDLVVGASEEARLARALASLGYEADRGFNALYGYRRMLFWDRPNERQVDVFVGRFSMCQTLELKGRLGPGETLTPADLLLTKLQIVELNAKDVLDVLALVASHEIADEGAGDVIGRDRLAAVLGADWGWYTTVADALEEVRARVSTAGPLEATVADRLDSIASLMKDAPRSARWRLRARVGRRMPWYDLPEEHVR